INILESNIKTLAYADNLAVCIHDKNDLEITESVFDLHCQAFNARINKDKTITIVIRDSAINTDVKDYNSKIGSAYLIKKESKPNLIPSLKEWNTAAGHEISLWLWKDVHKMKVLPKVKAFIWLLYNNGVYSAKRLNHMNSKISPNCTYCGKPENLAYVF
ncbi:hypothetical protein BB558_002885, partial [Smittium angustum]